MTQQRAQVAALDGVPVRVGDASLASEIASDLLRDLGANVTWSSSDVASDLAHLGGPVTPGGVQLSAYGLTGAYRDAPPSAQAVMAIGGSLMSQWSYRPGPVYLLTPYPQAAQGILAAIALLARRLCPDPSTSEVPAHVSALTSLLSIQSGGFGSVAGQEPDLTRWRHTPRGQQPTYATYQAADGEWLFLGASTRPFMVRVLETLGLAGEIPPSPGETEPRQAFQDVEVGTGIWKQIADVIATEDRAHWLDRFAEVGVPIGPVLSVEQAVAHPHVRQLGFVDDQLRLRNLVRVERTMDAPQPPPRDVRAPLEGLRVLEVTGYIAGSYTGRLLADLGADVVKVEAPGGDPFRRGNGAGPSLGFVSWNYGKRGLSLDVSSPSGRARVLALARNADIFVTNYRADSLRRLGLSREDLFRFNPALIHCSISAFGEGGPLSQLQGFDPIVQAFAGIQRRQGGEGEPIKSQMAATDYMSAMLAVLGVVAARTRQMSVGGGYTVSSSLVAGALLLAYDAIADLRVGRAYSTGGLDYLGPDALEGLHYAADGWFLATGAGTDGGSEAARDYLAHRAPHAPVATSIAELERFGLRAVPCLVPDALQREPHFLANDAFVEVEQPGLGLATIPRPVLRTHALTGPAPALGGAPDLSDWNHA